MRCRPFFYRFHSQSHSLKWSCVICSVWRSIGAPARWWSSVDEPIWEFLCTYRVRSIPVLQQHYPGRFCTLSKSTESRKKRYLGYLGQRHWYSSFSWLCESRWEGKVKDRFHRGRKTTMPWLINIILCKGSNLSSIHTFTYYILFLWLWKIP